MATSASRFATSTAISLVTATPVVTSSPAANLLVNASTSGEVTNSATVELATTLSCSGAPCAARTAAWASAPSTTICEAVASKREPPAVSVMPVGPRLTSWSPRWVRNAASACDTAGSLTPSAFAAAVTEPSLATSTNAFSCVSVITLRLSRIGPVGADLVNCAGRGGDPQNPRGCLGGRMQVPAYVEYEKATSVEHALTLLAKFGPEARILAGGHSLIPMMKLRLAQPEMLIDINALTDLRYIKVAGGELRIGALSRHADLLSSELAGQHFAILHDAERVIADPIVRLWGTVGGSICQADPSEDLSAAFAALKATMVIASLDGTRTVSARQFHVGPFETVVAPGEILTEIKIAIEPGGGSAYEKVGRRVGDWPVGAAGAAVWFEGVGDGAAEEYMRGAPASEESYARAGQIAAEHCRPVSDQRGPAQYKRHLACELTVRALRRAVDRAGAGRRGA